MIQNDFNKLLELFALEREGQIHLEEALKFASTFLDTLHTSYKEANETEKKDLSQILQAMSQDLADEMQKTQERFEMEEEEVLSLCENPKNFTDKQWAIVQEMRKKIANLNTPTSKKEASKPPKKGKWMRS